MDMGYKVLKDFIGTVNKKSTMLKINDIVELEDANEWINLQSLINCGYLMPIKMEKKKDVLPVFKR